MQPGDTKGDTKNPKRFSLSTKCCDSLTFVNATCEAQRPKSGA